METKKKKYIRCAVKATLKSGNEVLGVRELELDEDDLAQAHKGREEAAELFVDDLWDYINDGEKVFSIIDAGSSGREEIILPGNLESVNYSWATMTVVEKQGK